MRTFLMIPLFLFLSGMSVLAQKQMQIGDYDLGTAVPRDAGDNETVVIIKSPLSLSFESTMDKAVDVYRTEEESGFQLYYLKFSTLPKYKGRKLKIRSDNYETLTHPLVLTAKVPVGLYIFDPDGTIGVGCYYEHRNKGNNLFSQCSYEEAKAEYFLALECSDIPDENDLSLKIEDADNCASFKRKAEELYSQKSWLDAKHEYEKVVGLNMSDSYCQMRIDQCNEIVGNLPRVISGIVTDQSGKPLNAVTIKAEYVKEKKGKIEIDKKTGKPKTEYKTVGKTEANGKYSITVLNKSKYLEFSKGGFIDTEKYVTAKTEIVSDVMNISLKKGITLTEALEGVTETTEAVGQGIKEVKSGFKE